MIVSSLICPFPSHSHFVSYLIWSLNFKFSNNLLHFFRTLFFWFAIAWCAVFECMRYCLVSIGVQESTDVWCEYASRTFLFHFYSAFVANHSQPSCIWTPTSSKEWVWGCCCFVHIAYWIGIYIFWVGVFVSVCVCVHLKCLPYVCRCAYSFFNCFIFFLVFICLCPFNLNKRIFSCRRRRRCFYFLFSLLFVFAFRFVFTCILYYCRTDFFVLYFSFVCCIGSVAFFSYVPVVR